MYEIIEVEGLNLNAQLWPLLPVAIVAIALFFAFMHPSARARRGAAAVILLTVGLSLYLGVFSASFFQSERHQEEGRYEAIAASLSELSDGQIAKEDFTRAELFKLFDESKMTKGGLTFISTAKESVSRSEAVDGIYLVALEQEAPAGIFKIVRSDVGAPDIVAAALMGLALSLAIALLLTMLLVSRLEQHLIVGTKPTLLLLGAWFSLALVAVTHYGFRDFQGDKADYEEFLAAVNKVDPEFKASDLGKIERNIEVAHSGGHWVKVSENADFIMWVEGGAPAMPLSSTMKAELAKVSLKELSAYVDELKEEGTQ